MRYYLGMPPSGTARYTKEHLVEHLTHRRAVCGRRVYASEAVWNPEENKESDVCKSCLKMTRSLRTSST